MEGLGRLKRDASPSHFLLKIESFSKLSASSLERYESPEFEAADAKWRLAIYPNGNKARGGKDHISIYLVLADKTCLGVNKEIFITFRLLVFDHITNTYLTDEGAGRFNEVKYEYGFDKFLPLGVFKDDTNGYLINDNCLFGAEVFSIQHTYNFKCLSMVPDQSDFRSYTWKIDKFSKMEDKRYLSEKFTVWGYDWKLLLYPKGCQTGKENSISLYLMSIDSETSKLQPEKQVIVEYKLRVVDQLNQNHAEERETVSLSSSVPGRGWDRFLSFTRLKNKSCGYLVDDSMILEADVKVLGSTRNCV